MYFGLGNFCLRQQLRNVRGLVVPPLKLHYLDALNGTYALLNRISVKGTARYLER